MCTTTWSWSSFNNLTSRLINGDLHLSFSKSLLTYVHYMKLEAMNRAVCRKTCDDLTKSQLR